MESEKIGDFVLPGGTFTGVTLF